MVGSEAAPRKLGPLILEEAARVVGCQPGDCLFVGDNLTSDVAAAHAAGMPALLVLTGVARETDLAATAHRPDIVLPSVVELARQVERAT